MQFLTRVAPRHGGSLNNRLGGKFYPWVKLYWLGGKFCHISKELPRVATYPSQWLEEISADTYCEELESGAFAVGGHQKRITACSVMRS
ncbi:hypothetical protein GCM10011375_26230 [Hymenobacter qilianensis]|uniref:Uncharacterized protein n=1 Tax=Hymenobacter qilianensis TaxID=1385715 RepID=A0ACB5PT95_9BACT|nr:hypothetical protein [Hymenobacter qilianensis]GGF69865.1 hypothetical protein GCM10011375_26230 [Hymenobacter qilianensis]